MFLIILANLLKDLHKQTSSRHWNTNSFVLSANCYWFNCLSDGSLSYLFQNAGHNECRKRKRKIDSKGATTLDNDDDFYYDVYYYEKDQKSENTDTDSDDWYELSDEESKESSDSSSGDDSYLFTDDDNYANWDDIPRYNSDESE